MRSVGICTVLVGLVLLTPSGLGFGASIEPDPAPSASARADEPWWDLGWQFRRPVIIDNTKGTAQLADYPLLVNITYDSNMKRDFGDLRFVQSDGASSRVLPCWYETVEEGRALKVWVNVSRIAAASTTQLYMYYGNPAAAACSGGPEQISVFYEDFNGNSLDSQRWNTPHFVDTATTCSVSGGMLDFNVGSGNAHTGGCVISKVSLPEGSYAIETRLKFTDWYQSAFGAYAGFTNDVAYDDSYYGCPLKLVSARLYDYLKNNVYLALTLNDIGTINSNTQITVRNIWFRMTTYYTPDTWAKGVWKQLESPFTEQSLEISGSGGITPKYIVVGIGDYSTTEHTYFDYIIVRKYSKPEPKVSIGEEERPFKFMSFECEPTELSERDVLNLTARIDNPTTMVIPVNVSFRVGDDFNTADHITSESFDLQPSMVNEIRASWTATGGNNTLWFGLNFIPVASINISVNRYPVLSSIMDQVASQGKNFRLLLFAEDADGDRLNWTDDCPLFNLTPRGDQSAEINFTPTNDDVGNYTVNITVSDPRGCSDSKSFRLTVKNVNDYPVIEPIKDQSVPQDTEFRYRARASDIDEKWGDHITFSDDSMLFDIDPETGEFFFTPTNEQVGRYTITITATDRQKASASAMFNLTVTNVNDPPVINPIEPQTLMEDELWQAVATATDPDLKIKVGEDLRFSDDTFLFDIDPMTGLMSFTPTNDNIGVLTANITVTDLGGLSSTTTLVMTVLNTNDPPSLDKIKDATATEDELFEMTVTATDPDLRWGLDNLTFSDDSPLFDIDPRTGKISFTPGNEHVGKHLITIKVTDESGASDRATFSITVLNVNDPPFNVRILSPVDGEKVKAGTELWLNASAEDIDAFDVLKFSWFDNGEPIGEGKSISVKLKPGRHTISLEVSDGTEKVLAEVSVVVVKAEKVTVQDSGFVAGAGLALALVLVLVVVAGVVTVMSRRKRRPEAEAAGAAGAPGAEIGGAGAVAGASGAAAGAGAGMAAAAAAARPPEKDEVLDDAKKLVAEVEDALAEHLEKHPEGAAQVSAAMEKLELARDFIKEGDGEAAMQFAIEAKGALAASSGPAAPPDKRVKKGPGGLKCPSCGEALEPEWDVCPACGHKTR